MFFYEIREDYSEIVKQLKKDVEVKELGNINYYLGVQVQKEEDGSYLLNNNNNKNLESLNICRLNNFSQWAFQWRQPS